MSKFRVALSGDFKKPDGSPAFPDFDLAPLRQNPTVEHEFLRTNGVIQAADLEGYDALILLIPRIEPESFPKDGRLAITFNFVEGGNMKTADDGHMHRLIIQFVDKDHVTQSWTWRQDGKDQFTAEFKFKRVK